MCLLSSFCFDGNKINILDTNVRRILRRLHDAALDAPLASLRAELRAGLRDPLLGANPRLPKAVRLAALASVCAPGAARLLFGLMLRDRQ